MIHLYKITIISDQRCGSTALVKTINEMTGIKFWIEPEFNDYKNLTNSLGFEEFITKLQKTEYKTDGRKYTGDTLAECTALKCDYKTIDLVVNDDIKYSKFAIVLLRKNLLNQVLSRWISEHTNIFHADEIKNTDYYNLKIPPIPFEEVDKRLNMLEKNRKQMKLLKVDRVIYYEDMISFLSGNKLNTKLEMIENYEDVKNFVFRKYN